MDEQRQLGNILTVDLPQAKRRVDLNTKQHTWVGHSKLILPITDPAGRNLLTLKLGQQDRARAQAINLTPDTTWQQLAITGNTDDETTLKSVSFPTFTSSDVRLQNAYEALRDTWAQAGVKNLTIEDAYTITAIAADYLPDSIRMYQRLAHRSSLAAEQGATLLLEHFNLLQKQVDAILARETGNALADMHAQTRFLTGKTGQPTL